MKSNANRIWHRWLILGAAVFSMLFAGIIYAWSILKVPFTENFGWGKEQLALNFTLTMCFFCIGGLVGSFLARKIGVKLTTLGAAVLSGGGMFLTSLLGGENVLLLYLTYAVLAGLGIGIAYNVIISTVSAWFPDKKGLCSGALMMGFGASSLILGKLAEVLFGSSLNWSGTYKVIGISLFVVLALVAIILKRPDSSLVFPTPKKTVKGREENFEAKDYTTLQMLGRFTFWRAFVMIAFATAVGNSVISFARDLALSVDASAELATSLVGVLAICNGLGRILTGAMFDALGRKKTMFMANALTVVAAGTTLFAVIIGNLPLCIIGLCLTGLSYGTCPTMVVSFTSAFYGQKHFASNFGIMNCNLICASFIATACSNFDGFIAPFILLLILGIAAFVLNISIKRP